MKELLNYLCSMHFVGREKFKYKLLGIEIILYFL